MEAMLPKEIEYMMKEEELEDLATEACHISLLSKLEPPSFFLAPSGSAMLFFSRICAIISMVFFMHELSGCHPL